MKSKEKLLTYLKNQDNVKRIKELEAIIDSNEKIKALLEEKKHVSKEMLLARKLELQNTYLDYEKRYKEIDQELSNMPIVSEYLDLLDDAYNDLELMISYIENQVNKAL